MPQTTKQIVLIGDGTVGKTCLLHSYSNEGSFLSTYVPTIYEKEVFDFSIDGDIHMVKLIDTAGQEDYDRVRKLFYKEANCFILCYDISNRDSFTNISEKWLPELKGIDSWPKAIILVATKTDLRHTSRKPLITTEDGAALARQIKANKFIECSAKENINIQEAIHAAVRAAVRGPPKVVPEEQKEVEPKGWCCF